jgi:hypothetical protein
VIQYFKNTLSLIAFTTILIIASSGCSTAPVYISDTYLQSQYDSSESEDISQLNQYCVVNILVIEDKRSSDSQCLGSVAGRPVYSEEIENWLHREFKKLDDEDYIVFKNENIATHKNPCIDMKVALKKAYTKSVSTSMTTNIVLKVSYFKNDYPIDEKIYRGTSTRLNFASGESEINDAFISSFEKILTQIESDLIKHCGI